MLYRFIFAFVALLGSASMLKAQPSYLLDYTFDIQNDTLSAADLEEEELMLFQKRKVDIVLEGNSVVEYFLLHEKILINSDLAIERNNKIYVQTDENGEIIKNICQIILPNGTRIPIDDTDVHEQVDERTKERYHYYAVKGLEKGAILEKIYIKKSTPTLSGISYRFNQSKPIKYSEFTLVYPDHLVMKNKSDNGLPEAIYHADTSNHTNSLTVIDSNIAILNANEKLSNVLAHAKRFKYKLYKNTAQKTENLYNYNDFIQKIHPVLTKELSKSANKKLSSFLKDLPASTDERTTVLNIEDLIKTNIAFNADYSANAEIENILSSRQANLFDLMILYAHVFRRLNISNTICFTSDKRQKPFDPNFETTANLQEVLFYFPQLDAYLDPKNVSLRLPLISKELGNTHGIAIQEEEFEGIMMASTLPIFIPLPDMECNKDSMEIIVDFSDDITKPKVTSKISFGGYAGANLQPIKDFVSPDEYKAILEDIGQSYLSEDIDPNVAAEHDGLKNLGRKRFVLSISGDGDKLLQQAGDKYIFKIGQVIGPQGQLYQEGERTLPIAMDNARYYNRNITIKLPEGYTIANPEIFDFDHKLERENETVAKFYSKASLNDNECSIRNIEYYRVVDFPLNEYEGFCSVYNAAADFNKLTIVIQKQ